MKSNVGCREELIAALKKIIQNKNKNEFTIEEVVNFMQKEGTEYKESTIRTHISSRLCVNSPENHAVTYDDIERIDRGIYKLRNFKVIQ